MAGDNRDTVTRDWFLKSGTPGLPLPREAVPRLGFVSGTQDNNCVCIKSEDEGDEVCPVKNPTGLVYPWESKDGREGNNRLPGWSIGLPGPGLDPGLGSVQDTVTSLRRQIDLLSQ